MKSKKTKIIVSIIVCVLLIAGIVVGYSYKKQDTNAKINTEATKLEVEYSQSELTGEWADYKAKITLDDTKTTIEGKGVTTNQNTITIQSAGSYYITGSLSNGNIIVDAGKEDEVQLVLENASITSKETAPINGIQAGKLTITLAENSINNITDSSSYTIFTDEESGEPDGAIFTKTDLVINGNGTLIINASYADGIVSKDGLKIINSNIQITAKDDGIRGKDYIATNNANIKITSGGDGMKTTNDTDTALGYLQIDGGNIEITAKADGVQAQTILNISKDANINITTEGEVTSKQSENFGFGGQRGTKTQTVSEDAGSSKGLKAGEEITIESGNITINSTDDSIHSNGIVILENGNLTLKSGDDGIHADTNIVINNATINITKSYEGIESAYIEINGGNISLVASDDGINVSGGNDSSSIGGRMGQNNFSQIGNSNQKLVINGGTVKVNSTGDGLDANGAIYISGGNVFVEGPTSSGNGALDYDSECVVTGGKIIIYGAVGMWQNPSNTSTQYVLTFQNTGNAGDKVVLKDSNGNEISSFTTSKSYGALSISSSKIQKGETYTLYVNESNKASLTANSIITSNGVSSQNGMGMPGRMQDENAGAMQEPNGGMKGTNGRKGEAGTI